MFHLFCLRLYIGPSPHMSKVLVLCGLLYLEAISLLLGPVYTQVAQLSGD